MSLSIFRNSVLGDAPDIEKLNKEKQETEARLLQVEQEFKKHQNYQEQAKVREAELEKRIAELQIQLKVKEEVTSNTQNTATVTHSQSLPTLKPVSTK